MVDIKTSEVRRQICEDVFSAIVEKFAFVFAEVCPLQELSKAFPPLWKTEMSFNGEFSGKVLFVMPDELAQLVATNVLGTDISAQNATSRSHDACKELLNLTCGHLLTNIAGEIAVFNLSVPTVSEIGVDDWRKLQLTADAVGFIVDEYPLILLLSINV